MDHNDKQAIEGVFNRLAEVSRQGAPRDQEAETFIRQSMARQEGSAYYLAQTVVVQDHALNQAQARIAELEYQLETAQQARAAAPAQGGGFMSRLFGGTPAPAQPRSQPLAPTQPQPQSGFGAARPMAAPAQGGGFLAGAAQTAVGVAGGMMLGNMLGSMFSGGAAEAAHTPIAPQPVEEPVAADPGVIEDEPMDDGEW